MLKTFYVLGFWMKVYGGSFISLANPINFITKKYLK